MPEVRKQKEPIAHLNEKKYIYGSNTRENPIKLQGIVFTRNSYSVSGSKIDRQSSYSKIDAALKTLSHSETKRHVAGVNRPISKNRLTNELYSGSLGLFTPNPQPEQPEGYPDD